MVRGDYEVGCWALPYSLSTSGQRESLEGGNYGKSLAKGLALRWLLATSESPSLRCHRLRVSRGAPLPLLFHPSYQGSRDTINDG